MNMFVNETDMCETCPPNSEAKYNSLLCGMDKKVNQSRFLLKIAIVLFM